MEVGGISGEPLLTERPASYEPSPYKQIVPNCDWLKERGWTEMVAIEYAIERTLKHIKANL
jgi:hypothetical protein